MHSSKVKEEARLLRIRLGSAIANLRVKKGLSQVALSKQCHLAQSYLCDIEQGLANPTWSTLMALCQALRMPLVKLIMISELPLRKLTPLEKQLLEAAFSLFERAAPV